MNSKIRLNWLSTPKELLTDAERRIIDDISAPMLIDFNTGSSCLKPQKVNWYRTEFDYEFKIDAETYFCIDFGNCNFLKKIDVFLNGQLICDTNCNNIELKAIIPGKLLKHHNSLIAVIKEGAQCGIWVKDVGLVQHTPENYIDEPSSLAQEIIISNNAPKKGTIIAGCIDGIIRIKGETYKADIYFYENDTIRVVINDKEGRLVNEYCAEQICCNTALKKCVKYIENTESVEATDGKTSVNFNLKNGTFTISNNNTSLEYKIVYINDYLTAITVPICDNEAIFGLGENGTTGINKIHKREDIWVSHDLIKCDIPIPFYMSSNGYGLYLNSSYHSVFDMGMIEKEKAIIYTYEQTLDVFVMLDKNPKDIIRKFTDITGKSPLPPKWAFGFWQAGMGVLDSDVATKTIKRFRENDIPIDVICIDPPWQNDFCDYKWNNNTFPNPDDFINSMKENDIHIMLWLSPFVNPSCDLYEIGKDSKYFLVDENGELKKGQWWKGTESGVLDVFNQITIDWCEKRLGKLIEQGIDGFKIDGGDGCEVASDAYNADGNKATEFHNLYPILFAKKFQDIIQNHSKGKRVVTWERTGFTGSGKYPCTWGGDQLADFSGTQVLIKAGQLCGLVGIPFWSQDVGGFCLSDKTNEEFFIRSYQWGLIAPLSRAHGQKTEPWAYSELGLQNAKKYIKLRYKLMPYIYSLAYRAYKYSEPIMYPLFVDNIQDTNTYSCDYQYMLGENIMVAPIFEESTEKNMNTTREVYLPNGTWIDFNNNKRYDGGQVIKYNADILTLPMFIKNGAIIPKDERMIESTKDYQINNLSIYMYPDSVQTAFYLYDDDGISYDYKKGIFDSVQITEKKEESMVSINISVLHSKYKVDTEYIYCLYVYNRDKINSVYINNKLTEFEHLEDFIKINVSFNRKKNIEVKILF